MQPIKSKTFCVIVLIKPHSSSQPVKFRLITLYWNWLFGTAFYGFLKSNTVSFDLTGISSLKVKTLSLRTGSLLIFNYFIIRTGFTSISISEFFDWETWWSQALNTRIFNRANGLVLPDTHFRPWIFTLHQASRILLYFFWPTYYCVRQCNTKKQGTGR